MQQLPLEAACEIKPRLGLRHLINLYSVIFSYLTRPLRLMRGPWFNLEIFCHFYNFPLLFLKLGRQLTLRRWREHGYSKLGSRCHWLLWQLITAVDVQRRVWVFVFENNLLKVFLILWVCSAHLLIANLKPILRVVCYGPGLELLRSSFKGSYTNESPLHVLFTSPVREYW